ncbi:glycoside hydrolase family 79 protein, partial [Tulasnella calospora MUT 4182]
MPPQDAFLTYQTHSSAQNFWNPYINASQIINAAGKDFIMLETNTASCSRFAGGPDSYAGGLYLIDLALQGASIGVSQIILHNGGVGQAYNLFTPPPNNQSTFRQWTTAPHYYSTLIMSEVMEDGSQVMDLLLGGNSTHTPGYAIDKGGTPIKLALFNYITDPSGANDAQFNFPSTQPSVRVKYFSSATGSHTSSILLGPVKPWATNSAPTAVCKAKSKPKPSNATPVPARSPSRLPNS